MKIEKIKNLLDNLSKESLLIFGQHLQDLLFFTRKVPEVKIRKLSNGNLQMVNPSESEKYNLLYKNRLIILNDVWEYANKLYGEKVFGKDKQNPAWCYRCLSNHLLSKYSGKYTMLDDKNQYNFILPNDKVIHTTWNMEKNYYVKKTSEPNNH